MRAARPPRHWEADVLLRDGRTAHIRPIEPEDRVRDALVRLLGLRGEIRLLGISRWPRAVAQPVVGHRERIAALHARLASHPCLALAGAYLDGVAFADAATSGLRAAAAC